MAGCRGLKLSIYAENLPNDVRKGYRKKLKYIHDDLLDPYELSSGWFDDPSVWPDSQFGGIYCYLIETPGLFTKENLKAYKSLEAYNYVLLQLFCNDLCS